MLCVLQRATGGDAWLVPLSPSERQAWTPDCTGSSAGSRVCLISFRATWACTGSSAAAAGVCLASFRATGVGLHRELGWLALSSPALLYGHVAACVGSPQTRQSCPAAPALADECAWYRWSVSPVRANVERSGRVASWVKGTVHHVSRIPTAG